MFSRRACFNSGEISISHKLMATISFAFSKQTTLFKLASLVLKKKKKDILLKNLAEYNSPSEDFFTS